MLWRGICEMRVRPGAGDGAESGLSRVRRLRVSGISRIDSDAMRVRPFGGRARRALGVRNRNIVHNANLSRTPALCCFLAFLFALGLRTELLQLISELFYRVNQVNDYSIRANPSEQLNGVIGLPEGLPRCTCRNEERSELGVESKESHMDRLPWLPESWPRGTERMSRLLRIRER